MIFSVHLCADTLLAERLLWYVTNCGQILSQSVKWKSGLLLYQKQPTDPFFSIRVLSQILYLPHHQQKTMPYLNLDFRETNYTSEKNHLHLKIVILQFEDCSNEKESI